MSLAHGPKFPSQDLKFAIDPNNVKCLSTAQTSASSGTETLTDMVSNNTMSSNCFYGSSQGRTWLYMSSSSHYINTGISCNTIFSGGSGTMSCWVYVSSTARMCLFSGYPSGGANRWDFEISSRKMQGGFHQDGFNTASTTFSSSTDTHLAMTYDGTTLKFYLNGSADGSFSRSRSLASGTNLSIGNRTSSQVAQFGGSMNLPMCWNRALTADEISMIYNSQRRRFGV